MLTTGGEPLDGPHLRTSDELKINHLWLEHYVDEGFQRMNRVSNPNRVNRVWSDDIVAATGYIGPVGRTDPTIQRRQGMIRYWLLGTWLAAAALVGSAVAAEAEGPGILFSESFDDADVAKRGWYDSTSMTISTKAAHLGGGCVEYEWEGGGKAVGSKGLRHLFEPTEVVYIRFYIKLSEGWGWSGRSYHPHMLHFLTTENSKYHGPARSHLTLYIEANEGRLRLGATDMQNEDAPHALTQGPLRGGYNGKLYDSKDALLDDDDWHCVEAMFKLNSVDVGTDKWKADGELRGWFDGKLAIERTDVIFRTTDFPRMKLNQFLLAPYFGPGLLPHAQKLWIDELAVGTKRIGPAPRSEGVVE